MLVLIKMVNIVVAACCCGMGMKLKCLEGNGANNSYILLDSVSENKDHSTEKQVNGNNIQSSST